MSDTSLRRQSERRALRARRARTGWHRHANGQTLHVAKGVRLTQSRGNHIIKVHPGDVIWCPRNKWHWQGAAPTGS